jgi:hypothetical protein
MLEIEGEQVIVEATATIDLELLSVKPPAVSASDLP